jgi:GNAT superfamily N-acetyltransferase
VLQDFGGFRVVALLPRLIPEWPAPGAYDKEVPKAHAQLGAPRNPLPQLLVKGKPITAATIRTGPGFMEVPFVATHEGKRGRGYGRYMIEVIEDIARACGIKHLLLCSTNEESVKNTWLHLGFSFTSDADLQQLNVDRSDLMHMANTVQMHKAIGPKRQWRSIVIKHENLRLRTYVPMDRGAHEQMTGANIAGPSANGDADRARERHSGRNGFASTAAQH